MSADDLSGEWRGIFNYPRGAPPTEFVAVLHDRGGTLTGHTVEPSLFGGGAIGARLDGRRSGAAVNMVKLYEENEREYDTVTYTGSVDADGQEITGRWSIPGAWSGTFIMVREGGVAVEEEVRATEEVPHS